MQSTGSKPYQATATRADAATRSTTTKNTSAKRTAKSAPTSQRATDKRPYPASYPKSDGNAVLGKVYRALFAAGCKWESGEDWTCPAHGDERASLGVAAGERTPVVLHCAAGCKPEQVLRALKLTWASLGAKTKTTRWTYTDEHGTPLIVVTRKDLPDGKKQFYQNRADGRGSIKGVRRVLYDLPRLREVAGGGGTVYLVEGEKSVDRLNQLPEFSPELEPDDGALVATTALAGAAQAWPDEFSWSLRGARRVVIVADNDAAGYERARRVHDALAAARAAGTLVVAGKARKFRLGVVEVRASATLGEHDDVVEHLAAGHGLDELPIIDRELLDKLLAVKKEGEIEAEVSSQAAYTDAAAVDLLWKLFGDNLRYCAPKKLWLIWSGEFWRPDEKNEVYGYVREMAEHLFRAGKDIPDDDERKKQFAWAKSLCMNSKIESVVTLASRTRDFVVHPRELNADPYLFCCENGTLDLKTGELRPHRQTDLITVQAPVQFVPGARDKAWSDFLRMVLGGDAETSRFLKRAFYVTLMGAAVEKAFFNLYDGNVGNTGKTTFLECIKSVFGDYCATVGSETFLASHGAAGGSRSDLALCDGKRLVLSNEIPAGRKLDAEMLKKLTDGGGSFMYMQKYEKAYSAPISYTIWLDGNKTPRATVDDDPLFARWRLIEFSHQIPKDRIDPHWRENNADRAEFRAAVLWWIMSAREEYWATGLGSSARVDQASKEVRASLDPLAEFWEDHCVFSSNEWSSWADISTAKTIWARESGLESDVSVTTFRELLRSRGCTPGVRKVRGKVTRGWHGIAIKAFE